MFYLAVFQYMPNMASTNRIMAYVRALSLSGIDTQVVFFSPDSAHNKVKETFPHISFRYLWDGFYINLPRLNKVSLFMYIRKFVRELSSDDKVLVYGFPDLVVALTKRKDIRVYAETTEHPEASFYSFIKGTSVSSYLRSCVYCAGVIVISNGLRDYFINNGCAEKRVHVVNMIVDETRFRSVEKKKEKPYIAYCGTASNNKDGVDQLILAFSLFVKLHPEYKLLIIGSTPSRKQRFGNYELVQDLGISDKVVFTGIIPSYAIPQVLKNATILALDRPDNLQAKYGFPTKLGEYLLSGNPVVITRVGELGLFLKDKESAIFADPQNPQDFADKLCWVVEHPTESNLVGIKGKEVAELSFNYITETNKIIQIIQ